MFDIRERDSLNIKSSHPIHQNKRMKIDIPIDKIVDIFKIMATYFTL